MTRQRAQRYETQWGPFPLRRMTNRIAARFFAAWWGEDGVGPSVPVEQATKTFGGQR